MENTLCPIRYSLEILDFLFMLATAATPTWELIFNRKGNSVIIPRFLHLFFDLIYGYVVYANYVQMRWATDGMLHFITLFGGSPITYMATILGHKHYFYNARMYHRIRRICSASSFYLRYSVLRLANSEEEPFWQFFIRGISLLVVLAFLFSRPYKDVYILYFVLFLIFVAVTYYHFGFQYNEISTTTEMVVYDNISIGPVIAFLLYSYILLKE